uniref:Uncharacterized protein n=1 Tax=Zea mays TaxID=4577 RepID=A0A804LPN5_MAIZE
MVFEDMGIQFSVEPSCIWRENTAYPDGEWLPGAELNAAANCLTAKPGRSSDGPAIVWRDEGKDSDPLNFMSLEELRKKVWAENYTAVNQPAYAFTNILFSSGPQDAKVTMLGLVPSIVRTWKNMDCTTGLDWSSIRCFSSSREASSVDDYLWLMGRAGYKPVIEYCGGTEIGGGFFTGSMLQPQVLSAFSTPAMGCNLFILDSSGNPLKAAPTSLWRRHGFPTVEVAGVLRDGAPLLPLPLNTEIRNEEKDLNTSGILTAVEGLRRELASFDNGTRRGGEP